MDKTKKIVTKSKISKKEIASLAFINSLVLTFTFFFFGPMEGFLGNTKNFWFKYSQVLSMAAVTFVIAFAVCFLFCFLFISLFGKGASVLLFGTFVALYIQGNFMRKRYGILDGSPIDWSSFTKYGIMNTLIWAAIIIVPFVIYLKKGDGITKIIKPVSIVIILVQISTLVLLSFRTDFAKKRFPAEMTSNDMFVMGKEKNAIVLLLDSFDIRYMQEILETSPEYKDQLKDFTFYENMVGKYPTTKASIPLILTGEAYRNELPYFEFLDKAYEETPVFNELEAHGFDSMIYTPSTFISPNMSERLINYEEIDTEVSSYTRMSKLFIKFSGVKYFPHYLKQFVWLDTSEFDKLQASSAETDSTGMPKTIAHSSNDLLFYEQLTDFGLSVSPKQNNSFKFYHLFGAHRPIKYDENLQPAEAPSSDWDAKISQAKGSLNISFEFIDQLKKLGLYEDALIVLLADHGGENLGELPLLMVKKPGDTNKEVIINNNPLSFDDLTMGFLNLLTDGQKYGPYFDDITDTKKPREYLYHTWLNDMNSQFMQTMEQYEVVGDVSKNAKLSRTGEVFMPPMKPALYKMGVPIRFMEYFQTSRQYTLSGLAMAADFYSWSMGESSLFRMELDKKPTENLALEINFIVHGNADYDQEIILMANGTEVDHQYFTHEDGYAKFIIPKGLIGDDDILLLEFKYPKAVSPNVLSGSYDERKLSFGFINMALNKESDAKVPLEFNRDEYNKIEGWIEAGISDEEIKRRLGLKD